MAHSNDVIFTQQGLSEFIKQIRQNPEMVYKVRAATDQEIDAHNMKHPTLEQGKIPGKGITIIQADGNFTLAAVGSDVKAPNKETVPTADQIKENNLLYKNGTVTFIVDEKPITIPVKGIVDDISDESIDKTTIPNTKAIQEIIEQLENEITLTLNGDPYASSGFAYIPGQFVDEFTQYSETQKQNINNGLGELQLTNIADVVIDGKLQDGIPQATIQEQINTKLIELEIENNFVIKQYNGISENIADIESELKTLKNAQSEIENDYNSQIETRDTNLNQQIRNLLGNILYARSVGNWLYNISSNITPLGTITITKLQTDVQNINNTINTFYNNQTPESTSWDKQYEYFKNDLRKNNSEVKYIQQIINFIKILLDTLVTISNKIDNLPSEDQQTYLTYINEFVNYYTQNKTVNIPENVTNSSLITMINVEDNIDEFYVNCMLLTNEILNLEISFSEDSDYVNINNQISDKTEDLNNYTAQKNNLENDYNSAVLENNKITSLRRLIYPEHIRIWNVVDKINSSTLAIVKAHKVRGAVWNDYAEYRKCGNVGPGRVVTEVGDGSLKLSTARLQLGGNIISDTFGFSIGETEDSAPIAVAGRVLAYPAEDKNTYIPGAAVCSGPNGTVSMMTREEIREWPDAIIGYVSEIPDYEVWGSGNVKVDGRIWIKVH